MTQTSDGAASTDATDLRKLGYATYRSMMEAGRPEITLPDWDPDTDPPRSGTDGRVGHEIVDIGLISVFASMWAREGLSRRDRSLVTIGILIALGGVEEELAGHIKFGIGNGLTKDEISEVLYHAAGYTGFPRAVSARKAARMALGEENPPAAPATKRN